MTRVMTREDVHRTIEMTSDLPILGYMTWWSLEGIEVDHLDLETRMKAASFESFMPAPPSPRKAFRRALEAWLRASRGRNGNKKNLIRTINQPKKEWMVFALVLESADYQALGLDHATDLRILLHKKEGHVIVSDKGKGAILPENEAISLKQGIMPHWEYYRELHTGMDLAATVRKIIGSFQATSIRKKGGLYFIPVSEKQKLEKLQLLIEDLPRKSEGALFTLMPVLNTASAKRQMSRAIHVGLMGEITTLKSDLSRLTEGSRNASASTVATRLSEYKQLAERASIYTELLGMRCDEVLASLKTLRMSAQEAILSATQEKADE